MWVRRWSTGHRGEPRVRALARRRLEAQGRRHRGLVAEQAPLDQLVHGEGGDRLADAADPEQGGRGDRGGVRLVPAVAVGEDQSPLLGDRDLAGADSVLLHQPPHHVVERGQLRDRRPGDREHPLVGHRRQELLDDHPHELGHLAARLLVGHVGVGVGGHHQLERRHAEHQLTAVADGGEEVVRGAAAQPPQPAVVGVGQGTDGADVVHVAVGRPVDPVSAEQPLPRVPPLADEEHAELGQVLGGEVEAVAAVVVAAGALPQAPADPEGAEQDPVGVVEGGHPGGLGEDHRQQVAGRGVVVEHRPGRRRQRSFEDLPHRVGAVEPGDHVVGLVPLEPRGHGEQVVEGDVPLGRVVGHQVRRQVVHQPRLHPLDVPLLDGDPDQGRGDALGHRAGLAQVARAPGPGRLADHRAVADHHHGVDVPEIAGRGQRRGQRRRVDPFRLRRGAGQGLGTGEARSQEQCSRYDSETARATSAVAHVSIYETSRDRFPTPRPARAWQARRDGAGWRAMSPCRR